MSATKPLGKRQEHHCPLMAGISIIGYTPNREGGDPWVDEGTLTGLAVRELDDARVLVTALHVVGTPHLTEPTVVTPASELYQATWPAAGAYTLNPDEKVGHTAFFPRLEEFNLEKDYLNNFVDIIGFVIVDGVLANYGVHNPSHTENASKPHSAGTVAPGVLPPEILEEQQANLFLHFFGAVSGKRIVQIESILPSHNFPDPHPPTQSKTVMRVMSIDGDFAPGDSGGPLLWQDPDDERTFHMAGVLVTGSGDQGYAIPAWLIEDELGIKFGAPSADAPTVERPPNRPPVAVAKAPSTVSTGTLVTLDGSGSDDPDGDDLTYEWLQVYGSGLAAIEERGKVLLSDTSAPSPTFTAPSAPTRLTFGLTVTDPCEAAATAFVTVIVTASPVAKAGPPQTVAAGSDVTLDGSDSYDPDPNDTLTYRWQQVFPPGLDPFEIALRTVTLSCLEAVSPTFTAPLISVRLSFVLTVTDSSKTSHSSTVAITVEAPPTPEPTPAPDPGGGTPEPTPTPDPGGGTPEPTPAPDPGGGTPEPPPAPDPGGGTPEPPPQEPTTTPFVPPPWAPTEVWGPWVDTGERLGPPYFVKEQERTSNWGNTQTQWVAYTEPEVWGAWSRTGNTRGDLGNREAEETRISNHGNAQTRWVSDPEPEVWGEWTDTGERLGPPYFVKEQERLSNYDNRETRWVEDTSTTPPTTRPPTTTEDPRPPWERGR